MVHEQNITSPGKQSKSAVSALLLRMEVLTQTPGRLPMLGNMWLKSDPFSRSLLNIYWSHAARCDCKGKRIATSPKNISQLLSLWGRCAEPAAIFKNEQYLRKKRNYVTVGIQWFKDHAQLWYIFTVTYAVEGSLSFIFRKTWRGANTWEMVNYFLDGSITKNKPKNVLFGAQYFGSMEIGFWELCAFSFFLAIVRFLTDK